MAKRDVTFIVQGPLHENLIKSLPVYATYGHIIISCWSTCSIRILASIPPNISYRLVCSVLPSEEDMNALSNLFPDTSHHGGGCLQMRTVFNGLFTHPIHTKYVVKVRSDEYYQDWSHYLDILESSVSQSRSRLVCNNVFAMKSKHLRFHITDHIFGCRTDLMKEMFRSIDEFLKVPVNGCRPYPDVNRFTHLFASYVPKQLVNLHPEQIIAIAFLHANRIDPNEVYDEDKYKQILQTYFTIVPVQRFRSFTFSYNDVNVRRYEESASSQYVRIQSIQDMLTWNNDVDDIDDLMFYVRIGQYAFLKGEYAQALEHFTKVPLEVQKTNITIVLNAAVCMAKLTMYDTSISYFHIVLEHTEPTSELHLLAKRNLRALESSAIIREKEKSHGS